jgi:hypothetical protein
MRYSKLAFVSLVYSQTQPATANLPRLTGG